MSPNKKFFLRIEETLFEKKREHLSPLHNSAAHRVPVPGIKKEIIFSYMCIFIAKRVPLALNLRRQS